MDYKQQIAVIKLAGFIMVAAVGAIGVAGAVSAL